MSTAYFDLRDLDGRQDACPVRSCGASLGKAPSRWGPMPFCPVHCIRIHRSRTFVYYNGSDGDSTKAAASRNILFERDYFVRQILGNAAKAESHRICHETSEDALTWNVFSKLATEGLLRGLASNITGRSLANEPELYLWGLRIAPGHSAAPQVFPPLIEAREVFERGIKHFLTEPDIMLHVPGQLLLLVEAKFTSGNTIAAASPHDDKPEEKPKSRAGILRRYTPDELPRGALIPDPAASPFYSQLYRNLVFAIHMAEQLGVEWAVANLFSERQSSQSRAAQYRDPTGFIHSVLPENRHERFVRYSWERLYSHHIRVLPRLNDLADYIRHKSAYCARAFDI
jgi:hypothetical protein